MAFSHLRYTIRLASANGESGVESFYRAGSAIPKLGDTTDANWNITQAWISKRVLCLAASWRIYSMRVSAAPLKGGTESAPRNSLFFRVVNGGGADSHTSDVGAVTRISTLYSTNGHRREYEIHGIADDRIAFDAGGTQLLPPAANQLAYLEWIRDLSGFQLQVLVQGASSPLNNVVKDITVAAGIVTFTLGAAMTGLVIGDTVIISGCKGYKAGQFNARWKVATVANDLLSFTTMTNRLVDGTFTYVKSTGSARRVSGTTQNFESIANVDTLASPASTRKIGNPFSGVRGRRSAKR